MNKAPFAPENRESTPKKYELTRSVIERDLAIAVKEDEEREEREEREYDKRERLRQKR
jgi:hypothetical protein